MKLLIYGVLWAIIATAVVYSYSRADEAAVPNVKWKVVVVVANQEGDRINLTYGSEATGPVFFASKEECEWKKKSDETLATAVASVLAVAAVRGDKVLSVDCVMDDSGPRI